LKSKPGWGLWWVWAAGYTVLDMLLEVLVHGHMAWDQVPSAVEGALFGATVTWLFALWRWYKAEDGL